MSLIFLKRYFCANKGIIYEERKLKAGDKMSITDVQSDHLKKYILMHRKTETAELLIDEMNGSISGPCEIISVSHMPPGTVKRENANRSALDSWWKGRSIPASRQGIRKILDDLGIVSAQSLMIKNLALSLSDHYWIKPFDSSVTWDEINFFENDFSEDIGDLLFGGAVSGKISFMSPDNTSDGWLKKRWKIADGKRVLIKAGSDPFQQEPFNEVIASVIMERLGIPHVPYRIIWNEDCPYSVCDNFLDSFTELVSAHRIMQTLPQPGHRNSYQHFTDCCTNAGISESEIKLFLDRMITVDYIIANKDRHFNNFGLVRNSETLEYVSFAPLYDNGTSLFCTTPVKRIGTYESKPFRTDPEKQLGLVTSFDWFDASKLNGLLTEVSDIMYPLAETRYIDRQRIKVLSEVLEKRIDHVGRLASGK